MVCMALAALHQQADILNNNDCDGFEWPYSYVGVCTCVRVSVSVVAGVNECGVDWMGASDGRCGGRETK